MNFDTILQEIANNIYTANIYIYLLTYLFVYRLVTFVINDVTSRAGHTTTYTNPILPGGGRGGHIVPALTSTNYNF